MIGQQNHFNKTIRNDVEILNKNMKTFKDKFIDHQSEIHEKMNERLNSLATT